MLLFHDLDNLAHSIRDTKTKAQVEEVIIALRAGAARSALVTLWIAVIFDVLQKLRELSNAGDVQAKVFIDKYDKAIREKNIKMLLVIERDILSTAREEFELINESEARELARLQEDRNLCAHPAFIDESRLYTPLPENVHAYVVQCITILFQHKPLQGKAALESILEDIKSAAFPKDEKQISVYLQEKYLNRSRDTLYRNLLIILFKELLITTGDERRLSGFTILGVLSAIYDGDRSRLFKYKPDILKIFNAVSDDNRLLYFVKLVDLGLFTQEEIPKEILVKINQLFSDADGIDKVQQISSIGGAMRVESLKHIVLKAIKKFENDKFATIVYQSPCVEFSDEAIRRISIIKNYRSAELHITLVIIPLAQKGVFSSAQISEIIDAVKANGQFLYASQMPTLLNEFYIAVKPLLGETNEKWSKFLSWVSSNEDDYYAYPELSKSFVGDGYKIDITTPDFIGSQIAPSV